MSRGQLTTIRVYEGGSYGHEIASDLGFLYQSSAIKDPRFEIGDRVPLADGRVFRYAKAGTTVGSMKRAVYGYNQLVARNSTITCRPASIIAAGATSAVFTCTTTIGVDGTGVIAEDALRGGYISFYSSSADRPQRGIIGNSALASGGTSITLYFDAPIKTAIPAGVATEILANPYSDVRTSESTQYGVYCSALGMPNVVATNGDYFWIQTWGPFRITPTGAALGEIGHSRQFVFGSNGSIMSLAEWHVPEPGQETNRSYQFAGFLLERTTGEAGSAAPFINLQINP